MASLESFCKVPPGGCEKMDGGKVKMKLSEKTVSRRQNELVGKFNMAASDLVSARGQVMEYPYIPTGIPSMWARLEIVCPLE